LPNISRADNMSRTEYNSNDSLNKYAKNLLNTIIINANEKGLCKSKCPAENAKGINASNIRKIKAGEANIALPILNVLIRF
jgi:hypothetical protein